MREKKFFGKSRSDVLAKVRKECGENFYIIQVKKIVRKHFFGFNDESFEVLVAIPEFFLTPDVH
ncbi:MAG: hypothetical protein AABZ39_12580 [Spirochaetota bacterium]